MLSANADSNGQNVKGPIFPPSFTSHPHSSRFHASSLDISLKWGEKPSVFGIGIFCLFSLLNSAQHP